MVKFGCWLVGRGFMMVGLRVGVLGRWYIWVFRLCAAVTVGWILGSSVTAIVGVFGGEWFFFWVAINEFVGCL